MNAHIDSESLDVWVLDRRRDYQGEIDAFVLAVVRDVDHEMRGKSPHMVYELLTILIHNRLPGIDVDDDRLRTVAAQIAFGVWAA